MTGPLAAELKSISYVMTWDGIVTPYHRKYQKEIGIPRNVEAYIQTVTLRKTVASMVARGGRCSGEELRTKVARFIESGAGNGHQQAVTQ